MNNRWYIYFYIYSYFKHLYSYFVLHWLICSKSHIRLPQIADSLERNDGNQFPVQLRVVSVGVHRHRFLVDSMKRRMTDFLQMFLQFGFRPTSLRTCGAIEYWFGFWWVLVHSLDVVL